MKDLAIGLAFATVSVVCGTAQLWGWQAALFAFSVCVFVAICAAISSDRRA